MLHRCSEKGSLHSYQGEQEEWRAARHPIQMVRVQVGRLERKNRGRWRAHRGLVPWVEDPRHQIVAGAFIDKRSAIRLGLWESDFGVRAD